MGHVQNLHYSADLGSIARVTMTTSIHRSAPVRTMAHSGRYRVQPCTWTPMDIGASPFPCSPRGDSGWSRRTLLTTPERGESGTAHWDADGFSSCSPWSPWRSRAAPPHAAMDTRRCPAPWPLAPSQSASTTVRRERVTADDTADTNPRFLTSPRSAVRDLSGRRRESHRRDRCVRYRFLVAGFHPRAAPPSPFLTTMTVFPVSTPSGIFQPVTLMGFGFPIGWPLLSLENAARQTRATIEDGYDSTPSPP